MLTPALILATTVFAIGVDNYIVVAILPEIAADFGQPIESVGLLASAYAVPLALLAIPFGPISDRLGRRFSILATDISTRMLAQARKAVYPESIVNPIPLELRKKYLLRSKDRRQALVRIRPELRRAVAFERLNFMDRDYRRRGVYDAIFFRNVMIYFNQNLQNDVLKKFHESLFKYGYLAIGSKESLIWCDYANRFIVVNNEEKVYKKIKD